MIARESALKKGLPKETQSLCPECQRLIPARVFEKDGKVMIEKECPEHGVFSDIYWSDADLFLKAEKYAFDGVVCTDWLLLTGVKMLGRTMIEAKSWGVEDLSVPQRARKAFDAGVDQFGGEACPEVIIRLVENGDIDEARLDQSVRRILRDKFRLGLFDDPYVDPDTAEATIGAAEFRQAGETGGGFAARICGYLQIVHG